MGSEMCIRDSHRTALHCFAEEFDASRGGKDKSQDRLDGRGLAGAVWTEKPKNFVGSNLEADPANGFDFLAEEPNPKRLHQIANAKNGHFTHNAFPTTSITRCRSATLISG